ncbi:MAG: DUF2656 family protein [Phormidesmis sp.]
MLDQCHNEQKRPSYSVAVQPNNLAKPTKSTYLNKRLTMAVNLDGRMLLSHNFALTEDEVHPLNRKEFAAVFSQGLSSQAGITCALIDNPHWVVETRYETSQYTPQAVGQLCADVLAKYRVEHRKKGFYIMALGGLKTTPPTGGPTSLQTGEWGVDIVETRAPEEFLEEINWDHLAGTKPPESVFRIDREV